MHFELVGIFCLGCELGTWGRCDARPTCALFVVLVCDLRRHILTRVQVCVFEYVC